MITDENKLPDYEELFDEAENKDKAGIKVLWRIFLQNKADFLISILFYLLKNAPVWFTPIVISNVINIATDKISGKGGNLRDIWFWAVVGFVVLVSNIPFHVIYIRFTSHALRNIGTGMRSSLIRKLQHMSLTYHKDIESGRLQSKFLRDMEAVEFLNDQIIKSFIPCLISLLVYMSITISKSPLMASVFVLTIPASVAVIKIFRKKIVKTNRDFRHEVENVSAKVSDMIEMIPVTKAHGLEEEEISKLDRMLQKLKKSGMQLDKTGSYFGSVSFVVHNSISNLFVIFAAIMAYYGYIKVGDIVLFHSYFNSVMGNLNNLINLYQEIAKGLESLKSVSEIMFSHDIEDNRGKIRLKYVHGSVQFENVSYSYPDDNKKVIHNFNLDVNPGECIALVGSSGSGKSTIMNMIIGFLKPTEGVVKIDGKDINIINLTDYRKFIAFVPQNSILFTGTIKENILYGVKNVSEEKLNEIIKKANIPEFTDKMENGLDTFIGEHGGKLSGGQKQRISIARALIRDPKIIIFDEATSALDNVSEYHVQKAMNSLIKGRTTFIVAHRLSTIRDADRIVVMDEGGIAEIGTYDELMNKKGEFYKLKTLNDMKGETD